VHIRYNATSYSGVTQLSPRQRLTDFVRYLASGPRAPALPLVVFGAFVAWRQSRSTGALIIAWLLAGLALVVVQGKFYVYHWTVIFPPVTLLVAIAIDALVAAPPAPDGRRWTRLAVLAYAGAVAIIVLLAIQPARDITNWVRFMTRLDTSAQYYGRYGLFSG
jgi:4-amino-4-deoxy-L-arabinose transferase-like glycosyltransferase